MYLSIVDHYDVIIIGAGLAGLTAAIHLARQKHTVLVIEKQSFPHHKVCGEYVSNEVKPYLASLGIDLSPKNPVEIDSLELTTLTGCSLKVKLPLGGFGISRFTLDNEFYLKAVSAGAYFQFHNVVSINYMNNTFTLSTSDNKEYTARYVIGAFGKRSTMDKYLNRDFIQQKSSWLAIKQHYIHDSFPDNVVALHNFKGGYGGLSKTETGAVNFCYLASYKSFQKQKNIEDFNREVVSQNKYLGAFLSEAIPIFEEPLSIAQISFEQKRSVHGHMFLCGDSAGLIHPLCGNGMSMAIHSAKIASKIIDKGIRSRHNDRFHMENSYKQQWEKAFKGRIQMGRYLQAALLNERFSTIGMSVLAKSPWMLKKLIKNTHGKPIE